MKEGHSTTDFRLELGAMLAEARKQRGFQELLRSAEEGPDPERTCRNTGHAPAESLQNRAREVHERGCLGALPVGHRREA